MPARKVYLTIISAVSLAILLSLAATSVYACSPPTPSPTPPNFTFEDYIDDAPYIFVGTIVQYFSSDYGGSLYIDEVKVEVETYLKGGGSTMVRIGGFWCFPDCCMFNYSVGSRFIFFVDGNIDEMTKLLGYEFPSYSFISNPSIEDSTSIAKQSSTPYPLPLNQQLERTYTKYHEVLFGIGSIILLSIVVTTLVFFFYRQRSVKRKYKVKNS